MTTPTPPTEPADSWPRTYEISFGNIGPWVRDELITLTGIRSDAQLGAAVQRAARNKLGVRTPAVVVDTEAGTVQLDGGTTGTGTILRSWPEPAGRCGMGLDRQS